MLGFVTAWQHVAFAEDVAETIELLKRQIQVLTVKVQAMEEKQATNGARQLETNTTVATTVTSSDQETGFKKLSGLPSVTLGANGLVVQSSDSNFLAYLHGYMQIDGRFYPGDANSPDDTFLLRRVRPIFEGTVYHSFDYRLMLDFGSGNTVPGSSSANNALVDDAYVNLRLWQPCQIQVGKFKSPVGLERLESTADLMFIETGYATELTPNYDVGVELHNGLFNSPVSYAIGIFNGAADAGSDDQDVNENGKDVAGRLFTQPFLNSDVVGLRKLGFGVGGSYGDHRGSIPGYKTPGQQTFFSFANGVNANGQQYRIDPQLFYYCGPFGVLGEYALSSQKVRAAGGRETRLNNDAWQVEASYFLTGEENTFKPTSLIRVTPLKPFSIAEGGWGAFELAARAGQLSLANKAFPTYATATSAKEATSLGAGMNWYLNRNVKLSMDYEWTTFRAGSSAAGSVTSGNENFLVAQVQCAF